MQYKILVDEYGVEKFSSIYLGGGTPSLIPIPLLNKISPILDSVSGEKTIEVNPESITGDLLKVYNDLGINRLSMGIQSFQDKILKKMGRLADLSVNMKALELIEKYWHHNWSLDMIFGYPGQTKISQIKDILTLLDVQPPHFSLYTLSIEKDTPLDKEMRDKRGSLPNQDDMEDSWFDSLEIIKRKNYERYEISSFGLKDCRSQHNINYWDMGQWLGLGPGGGSHMFDSYHRSYRFMGKSLDDFFSSSSTDFLSTGIFYESAIIDNKESLKEMIMMGLRLSRGISLKRLKRGIPIDPSLFFKDILDKWRDKLILDSERLYLTEKGLDWHSAVVVDIFFLLDKLDACHE
jgi:oxygen-independent coproporphyrinogen-3 oxidase